MKVQKKISLKFFMGFVFFVIVVLGFSVGLVYFKGVQLQIKSQMRVSDQCTNGEGRNFGTILFLGDSLTAQGDWNTLLDSPCVVNAGVPGNITQDVFFRLDSVLEGRYEKIFLMIGVNDLLRGREVPSILEDYEKIVNRIREVLPQTTLFLESVLPTDNTLSKIGKIDPENIIALNKGIQEFSDEKHVFFLDIYPVFYDKKSSIYARYTTDGVHLSQSGYLIWKDVVSPYLR